MIRNNRIIVSVLVLGSIVLMSGCGGDKPGGQETPITIDSSSVIEEAGHESSETSQLLMKIAVAAMISPKHTYDYYEDLLKLIGERMHSEVAFIQKKTYSEVNEMLKRRELTLAFVCSGPYVKGKSDFGMEILAVPVSHGEKVYHSYFIVGEKSDLNTFEQLRGKKFAFTDPHSNTGCLVPTYVLAKRGETPESFFSESFFTYSHDNSIKAVAEGLADGAAVDSLIWEFMKKVEPDLISRTKIIDKSPPYGIPPVVVHPLMNQVTKEKLRSLFLAIHEDPKGREILDRLQIERFEPGDDQAYDSVREMQDWLSSREE